MLIFQDMIISAAEGWQVGNVSERYLQFLQNCEITRNASRNMKNFFHKYAQIPENAAN